MKNSDNNKTTFSLRKIFKGASIYSLGEVMVKASGFFLIPLYTRVLTPFDFGIVGYLQVFLQILTVLVAFGFHGAQTRFFYENTSDKAAVGRFAFSINLIPLSVAIILIIPLSIIGFFSNWTIGSDNIPFSPYMILTLWTVIFQVLANNAVAWFRTRQQFFVAAILQVTRFIFITGLTILLIIVFQMGALGRVAGLCSGALIFVVVSFAAYAKNFVWKPSVDAIKYAFSFGAPIVIHLLAGTIHNAVDRIILNRFVSLDELGIYTLAFTIGHAFNIFIIAFNQSYQPNYFQLMSSKHSDIKKENQIIRVFKVWLLLVTILATVGIILGKPFLRIFAGPKFMSTTEIFPWIILAVYFSSFYYFFSSPLFYFKKTKYLPAVTGSSALVNICLNFIMIPSFGIIGAAIATVVSHILQSLIALIIGNNLYKVRWPIIWILCSILLVGISFAANRFFL